MNAELQIRRGCLELSGIRVLMHVDRRFAKREAVLSRQEFGRVGLLLGHEIGQPLPVRVALFIVVGDFERRRVNNTFWRAGGQERPIPLIGRRRHVHAGLGQRVAIALGQLLCRIRNILVGFQCFGWKGPLP